MYAEMFGHHQQSQHLVVLLQVFVAMQCSMAADGVRSLRSKHTVMAAACQ